MYISSFSKRVAQAECGHVLKRAVVVEEKANSAYLPRCKACWIGTESNVSSSFQEGDMGICGVAVLMFF